MNGYLDDPEATHQALAGQLLRTGDLGYLRGRELFWVGRVQERINVRGVKLDPSDLEPILFAIQGLRPGCFAAFGLDDATTGTQRIVIVTELRDTWRGVSTELVEEIRNQVFLTLGSIDEVLPVREGTLTKTSSGKVIDSRDA
jgi:acyl-CoA synthetase (AMP-forming)/AMP-acid ligase II